MAEKENSRVLRCPLAGLVLVGILVLAFAVGQPGAVLCSRADGSARLEMLGRQGCRPEPCEAPDARAEDGRLAVSVAQMSRCGDCTDAPLSIQIFPGKVHQERKGVPPRIPPVAAARADSIAAFSDARVSGGVTEVASPARGQLSHLRTVVLIL